MSVMKENSYFQFVLLGSSHPEGVMRPLLIIKLNVFINCSISQSDFESIAHKCAKRIRRIESVEVDGSFVNLTIESQSGISRWDAQLMFELSGSAEFIGDYTIFSDNDDSNIPESVGKRIKAAILENVGIL